MRKWWEWTSISGIIMVNIFELNRYVEGGRQKKAVFNSIDEGRNWMGIDRNRVEFKGLFRCKGEAGNAPV